MLHSLSIHAPNALDKHLCDGPLGLKEESSFSRWIRCQSIHNIFSFHFHLLLEWTEVKSELNKVTREHNLSWAARPPDLLRTTHHTFFRNVIVNRIPLKYLFFGFGYM